MGSHGDIKKVKNNIGNHGETRQCNGEPWGTMGNIKKSKKYNGEPRGNQTMKWGAMGNIKKVKKYHGNHGEIRQCSGEPWGTMGNHGEHQKK